MACLACEATSGTCERCATPGGSTVPCETPTIPAPASGLRGPFDVEIIRLDSPPPPLVIELPDIDS